MTKWWVVLFCCFTSAARANSLPDCLPEVRAEATYGPFMKCEIHDGVKYLIHEFRGDKRVYHVLAWGYTWEEVFSRAEKTWPGKTWHEWKIQNPHTIERHRKRVG